MDHTGTFVLCVIRSQLPWLSQRKAHNLGGDLLRRSLKERLNMSQAVYWIQYKGKKILVNDYSGLKGEELLTALEATRKETLRMPIGSYRREVTILTDTSMTPESAAKGRVIEETIRERRLVGPRAMVGAKVIVGSVSQLIAQDLHMAKTVQEAKDWLVSQPD